MSSTLAIGDKVSQMSELLKGVQDTDETRANVLQLARSVVADLEAPDERLSNLAFAVEHFLCVRIGEDLDIFRMLIKEGQMSVSEISSATGADEALLVRVMRTLHAMSYVVETGHRTYAPNAMTRHLIIPNIAAGVRYMYDEYVRLFPDMPAYFRSRDYRGPEGVDDGPYQYAWKIKENYYDHMQKRPEVAHTFNIFMQGLFGTAKRLGWTDWFRLDEVCLDGFDEGKSPYAFVDVGGGKGHETELVLKKWPQARGKFVVQDQAHVLAEIEELDERIEQMPIDFMVNQPIKGARTYFLQNIMHNWATPVCIQILSHLREAMTPGYSKILIANVVIPDSNVPLRVAGLDLCMLVLSGGQQRDRIEWQTMIEAAGLHIAKIWTPSGDSDSIIEIHRLE